LKSFRGAIVAACALVAIACGAQSFTSQPNPHLEERNAWNTCVKPKCDPGGAGAPKSVDNVSVTAPALDGHSMRFDVAGPPYTNALWFIYTGEYVPTAPNIALDLYAYVTGGGASAQAFEYDVFEYAGSVRYMFGTQCALNGDGKWDVWDMLHGQWIASDVPCQMTVNKWHHIQMTFHRDGKQCDGYPCMYYDVITVDGKNYAVNMAEPSGPFPSIWGQGNNSGLNIQLDIGPSGAPVTEYIDKANVHFYGW
jgi:hypothetical protein